MSLKQDYQLAIHYVRERNVSQALLCYERICRATEDGQRDHTLDWKGISSLFYEMGLYDSALHFAKLSLESGSDEALSLYVKCCEEGAMSEGTVRWLHPYVLRNPCFVGVDVYFQMAARYMDIYEDVYNVFEHIDFVFKNNPITYASFYVLFLQMLCELEIAEGNRPQARYHLRRWMLLESVYLSRVNELLLYAIYLDDVPMFWKRKDTRALLATIEEEVSLFYKVCVQLYGKQTLDATLQEEFGSYVFGHPLLQMKKLSYEKWMVALAGGKVGSIQWQDWTEMKAVFLMHGEIAATEFRQAMRNHGDLPEAVQLYRTYTKQENTLSNVAVTVVGGGDEIGGSCLLVRIGDGQLMIDAGMVLHGDEKEIDFSTLAPEDMALDGLIITHAHMDHMGSVPHLYAVNPSLPMYATKETKALMRVMLKGDTESCLYAIQERDGHFQVKDWNVTFYRSGHILGAVSVLLEKDGVSVFVTGDYSVADQRTVQGLRLPNVQADLVITESTYGFSPTSASLSRTRQESLFLQSLSRVLTRGGSMLIPAFALGRAQEVIALLRAAYPHLSFHVYLDGMVCEVTQLYERLLEGKVPLLGKGVQRARYENMGLDAFVKNFVDSGNSCVIASAGMLYEGTKSMAYAERLLGDPRHAITFTGYLDEESPGFVVSQTNPTIVVDGKREEVRASVCALRLSAHASREEIIETVLALRPQQVMLVHGKQGNRTERFTIEDAYPTVMDLLTSATIPVIASKNGYRYTFEGGKCVVTRKNI